MYLAKTKQILEKILSKYEKAGTGILEDAKVVLLGLKHLGLIKEISKILDIHISYKNNLMVIWISEQPLKIFARL